VEDNLVEAGICAPCQEPVELNRTMSINIFADKKKSKYLDEEEQIWVLAFGGGPVALLDVVVGNVDTLKDAMH
jgi:hypothetical protein